MLYRIISRNPSWVIACSITALAGLAGLGCIALLFFSSASSDDPRWPVLDKRWIIVSYVLGVALVYIPLVAKRSVDLITNRDRPLPARERSRPSARVFSVRCVVALAIALAISLVDNASQNSSTFKRLLDVHEEVHLGSFQAISQGAIPYVEATNQYGPGYQIVSYGIMRHTDFSVLGYRVSFVLLNVLAETILYTLMFVAFGWVPGAIALVISLFFTPPIISTFYGWAVLLRWSGPLIVAMLFCSIACRSTADAGRYVATCLVGLVGGTLAWFSQENLSAPLAAAALIALACFGRGLLSPARAGALFAVLAASHVITFLALLAMTVGLPNLGTALSEYFRVPGLWVSGHGNTPWSNWDGPWTIAYYATPYIVIVMILLALYSRVQQDESRVAMFLSVAAAAAALVAFTLLRADEQHFLGPMSRGLPALLALGVTLLPTLVTSQRLTREALRAAVAIALVALYVAPLGTQYISERLTPDLAQARLGMHQLFTTVVGRSATTEASVFERRLGWSPKWDEPCCGFLTPTYADLRRTLDEIRDVVAKRSVYFGPNTYDAAPYFLGDFRVGVRFPSFLVYGLDDVVSMERSLRLNPPGCAVVLPTEYVTILYIQYVQFISQLYQEDTKYSMRDGTVFCRS